MLCHIMREFWICKFWSFFHFSNLLNFNLKRFFSKPDLFSPTLSWMFSLTLWLIWKKIYISELGKIDVIDFRNIGITEGKCWEILFIIWQTLPLFFFSVPYFCYVFCSCLPWWLCWLYSCQFVVFCCTVHCAGESIL